MPNGFFTPVAEPPSESDLGDIVIIRLIDALRVHLVICGSEIKRTLGNTVGRRNAVPGATLLDEKITGEVITLLELLETVRSTEQAMEKTDRWSRTWKTKRPRHFPAAGGRGGRKVIQAELRCEGNHTTIFHRRAAFMREGPVDGP